MKKYFLGVMLSCLLLIPQVVLGVTCSAGNLYQAEINLDKDKIGMNEKAFISINTNYEYTADFYSFNNSIATVSKEGIISPIKYGNALIRTTITFLKNGSIVATCPAVLSLDVVSSDSSLKSLNLEEIDISKTFNPQNLEYSVTVPYKIDKVNIIAVANNPQATINGLGRRYLEVGENVFDILVTASDSTTTTYKIKVIREDASNDNTLKSLNIENYNLTPPFNSGTYRYSLEVNEDVEEINIMGDPNQEGAKINGLGLHKLASGVSVYVISVTAENKDTLEYTIEVTKLNGSSILDDLKVKDYKLQENFEKDKYTYNLTVGNNVVNLDILAKSSKTADITISGNTDLKEGLNEIFIKVTETGKSSSTYKIIVNKLNAEEEKALAKNNLLLRILLIIFIISIIIMVTVIGIFIKRNMKKNYLINKKKGKGKK